MKQLSLKPQDFVVALKLAVNPASDYILTELSQLLHMPTSGVHGCIQRAEAARLVTRASGSLRAVRPAVKEFLMHGARYAYPAQLGALTRGVPTAIGAPVLAVYFEKAELVPVWPSETGTHWGPAVTPLHPAVMQAVEGDSAFYDVLALLDALRIGAARERELALSQLEVRFG